MKWWAAFRGAVVILLGLPLAAAGAATPLDASARVPIPAALRRAVPAKLQVYLMTFGPGRQVWERFGHNAIWIHDPTQATDTAYNYGLFDFQQENFLLRFVRGEMWYWMAGYPVQQYIQQYQRDDRSIWVQELELSPAAALELQRFLRWNAEPEHRFYHYDYYRDNCSTRIRDALDRVLGGSIRQQTARLPTGTSYRFHTQRLTANDALVSTGLLLALGQGVDRPISAWEEMFLPLAMRDHARRVTVPGPHGERRPLVRSERTLFAASAPLPPETPPVWLHWYLAAGAAIGGAAFLLGWRARVSPAARFGFLTVAGGWGLVAGLGGLVLAGLWGLTDHAMAYRNENLLQLNPLALFLLPASFAAMRSGPTPLYARWAAFAVTGLSIAGLLVQALPGVDQVNGAIIAVALPAHLGVAAAVCRGGQAPRTRASPSRASA